MKIFELLNPDQPMPGAPSGSPAGSPTGSPDMAPMASMGTNPMGTPPAQPPMQTAGMMDTVKNFFTTPQPIGSASGATTAPTPPTPTPGQPPAQTSGMISRPFGNTAIGRGLDTINGGLQGNPPKQ